MSNAVTKPTYEELESTVAQLRAEVLTLVAQVRSLKNHVFGVRSERFTDSAQTPLFALPLGQEESRVETTLVPAHARSVSKGRKPLPDNLPRERISYEADDLVCPCCKEEMAVIGEDITEELEYIPASFKIVEHAKIKRACSKCKSAGVVQGKLPAGVPVIEKGRPGPGLLAFILVAKYCDHMTLNRLEQMFARHGIKIPRQRMCDWIGMTVERLLLLIALSLKRGVRASSYIRADETELEVQTEENDGKLHKGRLWAMLSYEKDVYFEYAPTRSSEVAKELLSGVRACVQTDQYAGYNVLSSEPDIVRAGCWDHARRGFFKAKESAPDHAAEMLRRIKALYAAEGEFKDRLKREKRPLDPDERARYRKERCAPLLGSIKEYLDKLSLSALTKSPLGEAVAYVLRDWPAFCVFLEHGLVELSNAGVEQQIRPVALGRNNWFFAGSERGATWAAVMYSIIGTCKLNGINPYDYLVDILRRAPAMTNKDIDSQLTPRAWKAARAK